MGNIPNSPNIISFPHQGKEPGLFDVVIINQDLDNAYGKLKEALLEVKKMMKLTRFYLLNCVLRNPIMIFSILSFLGN